MDGEFGPPAFGFARPQRCDGMRLGNEPVGGLMAYDVGDPRSDYFVLVQQHKAAKTWAWEIGRRSQPMGVRFTQDGFASEAAAKLAGEKALHHFLSDLVAETRKTR